MIKNKTSNVSKDRSGHLGEVGGGRGGLEHDHVRRRGREQGRARRRAAKKTSPRPLVVIAGVEIRNPVEAELPK